MDGYLISLKKMVEFRKGKILIALFLCITYSCKEKHVPDDVLNGYVKQNFHKYKSVYIALNDSIKKWVQDSLGIATSLHLNLYQVDSVICFNSDSNRLFTTLNKIDVLNKRAVMDYIDYIGGAKIKEKWHFRFLSESMAIPREVYSDDIYTPLTLKNVSNIAHEEVLSAAVFKNSDGTYQSNNQYFQAVFYDKIGWACDSCFMQEDWDNKIMKSIQRQYSHKINAKELAALKEEYSQSVRPKEAKKKWWE